MKLTSGHELPDDLSIDPHVTSRIRSGYDGHEYPPGDLDREWMREERAEIALNMIAQWTRWAAFGHL
jgi:hypothetical protein